MNFMIIGLVLSRQLINLLTTISKICSWYMGIILGNFIINNFSHAKSIKKHQVW